MDAATIQWLVNFGACGVFLVLVYFGFFVPKPTVRKLEKALELREQENDVLRKSNRELAETAANSNQLIGALKSIAMERHGIDEPKGSRSGDGV